ncbi:MULTISPECIES: hypothetical protein [unclassified Sphingobacterium]|uniref:hypothetical protein n=1 Tax=unclassified Sphingobacterium TaxID=2609468 RepID=UPI0010540C21|nr:MULTISPECIES: hypothetical protein [unclassified Sphingobacterium]MCS3557609.1 hypothetical protein [Sphingobacterium sp. JUb21]TCQ95392.1 hypothetical protein EDF66_12926 [Sphingobacterium sp. JUb20]
MKDFIKTLFLFFIIFGTSILNSHAQSVFKNNKKISEIYDTYQNIDSIYIEYINNTPTFLFLYEPLEGKSSNPDLKRKSTIYSLDFEGDKLCLELQYNLLYRFIFQDQLGSEIQKSNEKKNLNLVITSKKSVVQDIFPSGPGASAILNPENKQDFITLLNTNYKDCTDVITDSVLIIQAVINRIGGIQNSEIIYGKSEPLYQYLMKTYHYFEASQPVQEKIRKNFPNRNVKWLFKPRVSNTQRTSLIDIYLRLNPDKTFTFSAEGSYRRLKIKDYQEDPNDPIFY